MIKKAEPVMDLLNFDAPAPTQPAASNNGGFGDMMSGGPPVADDGFGNFESNN